MGFLDDILGKLIDIDFKPQSEQMGVFNVKTAKNTYNLNLNFSTPEAAKAFAEVIVAGNQTKIVEGAEKLLAGNSTMLKVLPQSTAVQVANATIVTSFAAASGVEGKVKMEAQETLTIQEKAFVKLSPESDK